MFVGLLILQFTINIIPSIVVLWSYLSADQMKKGSPGIQNFGTHLVY